MLMILIPIITLTLVPLLSPIKRIWEVSTVHAMVTAALSTVWLHTYDIPLTMNPYFFVDEISSPLLILTCWLTAPTLLASQSSISKHPAPRQRAFIFTVTSLQALTALAFLSNDMLLFFIFFESTIIPTMILITRWGAQKERLVAGTYFLFYTLFGSMALLSALIYVEVTLGTLSIPLIELLPVTPPPSSPQSAWWAACFAAFLIKMPLYGLHLWLPKAHVEAPIAGSMLLAGTLLKLGGYGILRMNLLVSDSFSLLATPTILFSLFGTLSAAVLCARQTDLKSMVAYSSVSHMGLVIAASLIKTEWSITGALLLMVSHGLISSALFCLVNISYERTHSRALIIIQGGQIIFPLMAAWWLLVTLMNISLPPTPNFFGELSMLMSIFEWSQFTLLVSGLAVIFSTLYSLYMFWSSQRGRPTYHFKALPPVQTREHLLLILHLYPAILLMIKPGLLF